MISWAPRLPTAGKYYARVYLVATHAGADPSFTAICQSDHPKQHALSRHVLTLQLPSPLVQSTGAFSTISGGDFNGDGYSDIIVGVSGTGATQALT